MPASAMTPVTSAMMPGTWASVGITSMQLQPIRGATSLSMAVGRRAVNTLLSSSVDSMVSTAALTILLSTLMALATATSPTSTSPE